MHRNCYNSANHLSHAGTQASIRKLINIGILYGKFPVLHNAIHIVHTLGLTSVPVHGCVSECVFEQRMADVSLCQFISLPHI